MFLICTEHSLSSNPNDGRPAFAQPRSRGSTHRSLARPLGDTALRSVQEGNELTSRTLVLALICAALGVWWVLEQPKGSLLERHPLFQRILALMPVYRASLQMRTYGHATDKPTWLYSSTHLIGSNEALNGLTSHPSIIACKVDLRSPASTSTAHAGCQSQTSSKW